MREAHTGRWVWHAHTHFRSLEAKSILTRERIGNYCMKIPKAVSPI